MKNYLLALVVLTGFALTSCSAGYVSSRPVDVVYARPASPGPGYVWTSGEWVYTSGNYHWREGAWQPSREGHNWKAGYWENGKKGYKWHKGGWSR